MTKSPARLHPARTIVLSGLAVVWFVEMVLSAVRPLMEKSAQFWGYVAPGDPRLSLTYAILAASKGALGVLAVYALRSRSPLVRSALYIPMALVPPLNVVFPFQAQGFLLRPTLIGTTLSVILWQTFLLMKDDAEPSSASNVVRSPASRWDAVQYGWFAANAVGLTLVAALFLFAPEAGVRLAFPCVSGSGDTFPSGLTLVGMVVGTHLTAVATATWLGTYYSRKNATVRQGVAAANTLHAIVLCALPLAQLTLAAGRACAASSLLVYAIPMLGGWLAYLAILYRNTLTERLPLVSSVGH